MLEINHINTRNKQNPVLQNNYTKKFCNTKHYAYICSCIAVYTTIQA